MSSLFKHQAEAIETLTRWEKNPINGVTGGILAFQMGLGKTRIMLELIYRQCYDTESATIVGPVLVVCNKSNIQVWIAEIEKFYQDSLSYFVYHSDYCKLSDIIPEMMNQYHIIITTYEVVRSQFELAQPECFMIRENNFMPIESGLYKRCDIPEGHKIANIKKANPAKCGKPNPIYSIQWWKIISDESQRFASTSSKLYQAMVALNASSYFCLTGTPIVNYESDLFSMFRFLGWFGFLRDWGRSLYHTLNFDLRILSKKREDTDIVLPEIKIETVKVQLSDMEKKVYNQLVNMLADSYTLFKQGLAQFAAPLSMFTRLRQTCVCSYIMTKESKRNKNNVKLQELKNIQKMDLATAQDKEAISNTISLYEQDQLFVQQELNEFIKNQRNIPKCTKIAKAITLIINIIKKGGKVLVFSSFVSALDQLKRLLEKKYPVLLMDGSVKTEDRQDMVEAFNNNPKYQVFLSSFKTGGVGLNLTGADNVILLEPWWNTATEEQAICRAHRIGQKKSVTVYNLIAIPSFETYLLEVQRRKNKTVNDYLGNGTGSKYDRLENDKSLAQELIKYIVKNKTDFYYI